MHSYHSLDLSNEIVEGGLYDNVRQVQPKIDKGGLYGYGG